MSSLVIGWPLEKVMNMDLRSSEDGSCELIGEHEFPCSGLKVCLKGRGYLNTSNELSNDRGDEGDGGGDGEDGDANDGILKACCIAKSILPDPSSNSLTAKPLE